MVFTNTSCISWDEGWQDFEKQSMEGDVRAFINLANQQISMADNKQKVFELIGTYEKILKIEHRYLDLDTQ